ncbi:MAG: response regulator [Polyangiaceae bacterium]
MQIVLADDDEFSRALLVRTLQVRTSYQVTPVADGHLALELALSDNPPDVLLLDWMMPTMTGTEVCRRVRAAPLRKQPYILLVTAKNQRNELVEGLGVGADDLLTKPVPPDVLVARLRSAELHQHGRQPSSSLVLRALRAARNEGSGELVVRDGDVTAHVYFQEGAVAWAHLSDDRSTLFELLSSEAGLDADSARAIIEECRQTGARLSDTLVRWGFTDRASLRNSLQVWITKKLAAIMSLRQPQTLFLPRRRRYAEDMLFDLNEVAEGIAESPPSIFPPAYSAPASTWNESFVGMETDVQTAGLLDRCMTVDGMRGVAVLDRELGCCFGQSGTALNPHIAWALLQGMSVVSRHAGVEDAVLVAPPDYHLIRMLPETPSRFVYGLVSGSHVLLGAARLQLQQALTGG